MSTTINHNGSKTHACYADHQIYVWDEIAGHYTTVHNLTPRQVRRVKATQLRIHDRVESGYGSFEEGLDTGTILDIDGTQADVVWDSMSRNWVHLCELRRVTE